MMVGRTVAYTDGACLGNPGPGGWAWAVPDGPFASGAAAHTTNQRMEINAALEAVQSLEGPLEIVSDSTYVVNCFRDGWWVDWERRGWLNKAKKPIANQDLWQPLIELYKERRNITFRWVKGHSGDEMNDIVDRLAVEAATTQHGRTGTGRPADLGPADAPDNPRAATGTGQARPALPPGHHLLVAGLRPPDMGGYDANPVADRLHRQLTEILQAKAKLHPDLHVLTGLGLGAEQLGAQAALDAGVPYVAVLAFPDPDGVWPEASRKRFRALLDGAAAVVVLEPEAPRTKQKAGASINRRDAWLVRQAAEAVVVWDAREERVGKLVHSLTVQLGEEEVWVVEPSDS